MSKIAIITDSTCSIPADLVTKHDIRIIPQHIIWGTEDLLDMKDIDAPAFYQRLVKDPIHPKTSQPPAPEFANIIKAAQKDGATEVFIATVSGPLSGTFASAEQAKAMVDIPAHVHDSKSAAMGLGWGVIAAARARDKGANLQGMADAAENVRNHMVTVLVVDTLEFLHKGGRIGGAARLFGTMVGLKPQLVIDSNKGTVERGQATRTRKKSIEAGWSACFDKLDTSKPLHVAVHHANAEAECKELYARVKSEFPKAEVVMTELTPVLGVHGGPGTLAFCAYYEA